MAAQEYAKGLRRFHNACKCAMHRKRRVFYFKQPADKNLDFLLLPDNNLNDEMNHCV